MLRSIRDAVRDDAVMASSGGFSIVIPAHNEERRIGPVLHAMRAEFPDAEIIVVANACTDATADVVAAIAQADPDLRLINLAAKLGKGGSVRLGFQVATADVIAFADADGATSPAELRRLVAHLGEADGVVASRWSRGSRMVVGQSPLRRLLSRGFNAIVRLLFGLPFADTQCGAKVFRRAAIEEIVEEVEIADFAFDVDVLFQLQRRGRVVREVPITWSHRDGSTVNVIFAAPRMLASIVRLRLHHSPLRYGIPFFDRLFGIHAIKCRRLLRILVVSPTRAEALVPDGLEHRFHTLVQAYRSERRCVEWWSPTRDGKVAWEYLRRHRSRFDCVVEISPNGTRYWTPFYSLKPVLMVAPHRTQLRWPYARAELMRAVPECPEALEDAIRRAMTRSNAYFIQELDGSWSFHPRRAAAHRVPHPMPKAPPAAATAPAPILQ